jgi:hypothetical protein
VELLASHVCFPFSSGPWADCDKQEVFLSRGCIERGVK